MAFSGTTSATATLFIFALILKHLDLSQGIPLNAESQNGPTNATNTTQNTALGKIDDGNLSETSVTGNQLVTFINGSIYVTNSIKILNHLKLANASSTNATQTNFSRRNETAYINETYVPSNQSAHFLNGSIDHSNATQLINETVSANATSDNTTHITSPRLNETAYINETYVPSNQSAHFINGSIDHSNATQLINETVSANATSDNTTHITSPQLNQTAHINETYVPSNQSAHFINGSIDHSNATQLINETASANATSDNTTHVTSPQLNETAYINETYVPRNQSTNFLNGSIDTNNSTEILNNTLSANATGSNDTNIQSPGKNGTTFNDKFVISNQSIPFGKGYIFITNIVQITNETESSNSTSLNGTQTNIPQLNGTAYVNETNVQKNQSTNFRNESIDARNTTVNTNQTVLGNDTKPRNLALGELKVGDVLLYLNKTNIPANGSEVVVKELTIPSHNLTQYGSKYIRNDTLISYIGIVDLNTNETGGYHTLIGGGIGYPNVTIRLTSGKGQGLYFAITLFGN